MRKVRDYAWAKSLSTEDMLDLIEEVGMNQRYIDAHPGDCYEDTMDNARLAPDLAYCLLVVLDRIEAAKV